MRATKVFNPTKEFEEDVDLILDIDDETGEGYILWTFFDSYGDQNEVCIGIWSENKVVNDYDGVFGLTPEIIQFLQENGFDTTEIE